MTTTTQTLASWLLEQIAADEAVVRSCLKLREHHEQQSTAYRAEHPDWYPPERMAEMDAAQEPEPDWYENEEYDHLCARPEHALALCAAHRAIVELHKVISQPGGYVDDLEYACRVCWYDIDCSELLWRDEEGCDTLRALAQPYADRPGWREEWAA